MQKAISIKKNLGYVKRTMVADKGSEGKKTWPDAGICTQS